MNDPQQQSPFVTTRWSLVQAAGQRGLPECEKALAALCQAYWGAVYVFVRKNIADVHEAQDLTQAFFAHLLEHNMLAVAQPTRGRFRSFLLTAVRNFLSNEWDKRKTLKRGGAQKVLALDFGMEDSTYSREPADTRTPDRIFERRWVLALLEQVMARMREEYGKAGKAILFDHLKNSLSNGDADAPLAEIARQLGISENAAKVAVHRMRKRYRELLRAEVAHTLADPREIDDEIRHLFAALRA